MTKFCFVYVTCPNKKTALLLTQLLLQNHLAACVNIVPSVESHYWWTGKIEKSKEVMLIAKTRQSNFTHLVRLVNKAHPYDVPEIVALPVVKGSAPYLNWLKKETQAK
jgi:periplasmic divalent cation tolerance protein